MQSIWVDGLSFVLLFKLIMNLNDLFEFLISWFLFSSIQILSFKPCHFFRMASWFRYWAVNWLIWIIHGLWSCYGYTWRFWRWIDILCFFMACEVTCYAVLRVFVKFKETSFCVWGCLILFCVKHVSCSHWICV